MAKNTPDQAFLREANLSAVLRLIQAQAPYLPRGSTVILITPSLDKNIEAGVEEMIRRSLQPVVVLIDRSSFGGRRHADEMVSRLRARRVPVALLRRGEDIRATMEAAH